MLKLGPILDDLGAHFGDFFGRGRYAKIEDSCIVLRCFADLRGAKKGTKNRCKMRPRKICQKIEKWGPAGVHLGGCWDTFLSTFWMSVLGRKLDTFGYYDAVLKWPHRGTQEGYLTEVKYPGYQDPGTGDWRLIL